MFLFGSISKMLAQGLIEESDDRPDPHLDDERRRYYQASPPSAGRSTQAERQVRDLVALDGPVQQIRKLACRTSCAFSLRSIACS